MFSLKFNQIAAGILMTAAALTGCSLQPKTAEQQKMDAAGVELDQTTCVVVDKHPENKGFFGYYNKYDFKNGVLHFKASSNNATSQSFKNLAEDGQARATEMFTFLAGTNCKAPKFGP